MAAVAVVVALLVKAFLLQAYRIPSGSMQDTLQVGDRVLVNKLIYDLRGIHRGDIVVFSGQGSWGPSSGPPPANPVDRAYHAALQAVGLASDGTDYIKRVIGLPGDHVVCCDDRGRITVNGVPLDETSYVYPGNSPSATPFSVTVPAGHVWVMGDHRGDSADSRFHMDDPGDGSVPESAVVGRAFAILWPPSQWHVLPIPATFQQSALNDAGHAMPAMPLAAGGTVAVPLAWLWRRRRRATERARGPADSHAEGSRGQSGGQPALGSHR